MSLTKEQDEIITSLYLEMYQTLVNIAYVRFNSRSLAEEAAQETFCIACRKPGSILSSENPQGWLVTTLLYVIKNMKRFLAVREKRVFLVPERHKDKPHYDDYSGIEYSDLLSDAEYQLFRRIAVDRYSMKEAAYELGISEEACKKRVQRIRAKLQKQILNTLDDGVPEK